MAVLATTTPTSSGLNLHRQERVWLIHLLFFFMTGSGFAAQTPPSREYQIKAVFLFNFAQFVDWPPKAFPDAQTPLTIGVLGTDPFGSQLDEIVHDEKIGERPLLVRRFKQVEEIDACHILFISQSETARLDHVIAGLKDRGILTVCDTEGFTKRGVMIRFITEKNRIRLRINLGAAKSAGLTISSKLLRPAEIVSGPKD